MAGLAAESSRTVHVWTSVKTLATSCSPPIPSQQVILSQYIVFVTWMLGRLANGDVDEVKGIMIGH